MTGPVSAPPKVRGVISAIARSLRPANDPREQRMRLWLAMLAFGAVYMAIGGRLVMLAAMQPAELVHHLSPGESVSHARPDILDRSGTVLATDIMVPSVYAEPHRMIDVDAAIEDITSILPDLSRSELRRKLTQEGSRFAWIKREITPRQRAALHSLGVPGLEFLEENQRFYPAGRITSHALGHVNIDNFGTAGIEKYLDDTWLGALHAAGMARTSAPEPVSVSLDLRVQHAMRDEIASAVDKFKAIAGAGVVLDVHTGEVVAMVSLPDYDPHQPAQALEKDNINRVTTGVYELGSTFKTFTVAMGLDLGTARLNSTYDARSAIRVGGFTIGDFHGKNRVLTTPEVFIYSSNIGTARMALEVTPEEHRAFLERLGFFSRVTTELPESSRPIAPSNWKDLTRMTVSFGHGISVSPLHAAVAGAALVNGGYLLEPTFMPRSRSDAMATAKQVLKPETSEMMRYLMRLNVEGGTATKADVPGYRVGGKTGTAEKVVDGRYSGAKVLTSFLGVFPADDPQYLMLVMLDEPQGITETHGYRTAGWNSAPTTAKIVRRIAPILGVEPRFPSLDGETPLAVSY